MLELKKISLMAGETTLLHEISLQIPTGHLCAVVGPSGCGKSTLLKVIAGLREADAGGIFWNGRDLEEKDLEPHQIGYVPQFSIAYERLSIEESVDTALRLRVGGLSRAERRGRLKVILRSVGLVEIAERKVRLLSGGQRRRLALALEMVSDPVLLLCDEVTSGLDAKAEDEIVSLLRTLAAAGAEQGSARAVISVTHSLRQLELHDSVAVLYQGNLVYHASPALLCHYFGLASLDELFPALSSRETSEWRRLWKEHRREYAGRLEDKAAGAAALLGANAEFRPASWLGQCSTLVRRRWLLFARDWSQMALQAALLFGFPCLVVIFAWDGLPQIKNLTSSGDALKMLVENVSATLQSSRVASLVSGLVMFQVILLTLIGSNNAAREIAGERAILEKEKFAGLHPSSYIASKLIFLALLVGAQSVWMTVFVSTICRFPGDLLTQALMLLAVNAGMTSVCLGLSALMRTAESASLLCVYLVGFQLPLSGAVLALPRVIGWITQPFIVAFWGWSGYLQTMRDTRFYDAVQSASQTELAPLEVCGFVLATHVAAGLFLSYLGAKRSQWD